MKPSVHNGQREQNEIAFLHPITLASLGESLPMQADNQKARAALNDKHYLERGKARRKYLNDIRQSDADILRNIQYGYPL